MASREQYGSRHRVSTHGRCQRKTLGRRDTGCAREIDLTIWKKELVKKKSDLDG